MTAVITPVETRSDEPVPSQNFRMERITHRPFPEAEAHAPGYFRLILRGAILVTLGAGALILLLSTLTPVVFLALLLFLPALAPIILLGFVVLVTEDLQNPNSEPVDARGQPCTCHQDRMARSFLKN